jgi:hypothetical protein
MEKSDGGLVITIPQPTVVNVDGPLQNVSSKEIDLDEVILGEETPIPDVNLDYERKDGK